MNREAPTSGGILHVVATPIGNRGDLSPRALEVLSSVALIAAEDTRHTGQLLQNAGVKTPLHPLHEHNETREIAFLLERLRAGRAIALVTDAGTPLVSDPGFELVRAALQEGFKVSPVPGPCAAIAALSICGLPSARFVFEGFLPAKTAARRERLEELRDESRTLIFYEAPHRIEPMLREAAASFGNERLAVVCRELTKLHEAVYRGSLEELANCAATDPDMSRGEIVVLIQGNQAQSQLQAVHAERLLRLLSEELPPAQAAKLTARITGVPRRELYNLTMSAAVRDKNKKL
jgi:16S rRNA (cytidine1402-2'-O)-methyltransferase